MGSTLALAALLSIGRLGAIDAVAAPDATEDQELEDFRLTRERFLGEYSEYDIRASAPVRSSWYGMQLFASDLVSLSFLIAAGFVVVSEEFLVAFACLGDAKCEASADISAPEALVLLAFGTQLIVPPLIHVLHGRYAEAAISFGLRLSVPLLLFLTGNVGVALIAYLVVLLVDDIGLAWEPAMSPAPGYPTATVALESQPALLIAKSLAVGPVRGGGIGASYAAHW